MTSSQVVYFHTVKISNVLFFNVTSRHVLHARFERKSYKSVINRMFNVLNVKNEIYFTCETGIFYMLHVLRTRENIKNPAHSWNKYHTQHQSIEYPLFIYLIKEIAMAIAWTFTVSDVSQSFTFLKWYRYIYISYIDKSTIIHLYQIKLIFCKQFKVNYMINLSI